MKKHIYLLALGLTTVTLSTNAQTKIKDGTLTSGSLPNPGALLELESNNKGLLLPRVALSNTTDWGLAGSASQGMTVYDSLGTLTSTNPSYPILPGGKGIYYWDGTGWIGVKFSASAPEPWKEQNSINDATSNNQNIFQTGKVAVGSGFDTTISDKQLEVAGTFRTVTPSATSNRVTIIETNSDLVPFGNENVVIGALDIANQTGGVNLITPDVYLGQIMSPSNSTGIVLTENAIDLAKRTDSTKNELYIDNISAKIASEDYNTGTKAELYLQSDLGNAVISAKNPSANYETRLLIDHNADGSATLSTAESDLSGYFYSHKNFSALKVQKGLGITFYNYDANSNATGAYTFPKSGGNPGQVLTTQGGHGGNLYWSDPVSIPEEPWRNSATGTTANLNTQDIYQDGKIGIGRDFSGTGVNDMLVINRKIGSGLNDMGITIDDGGTHNTVHLRFDNLANGSHGHIDWMKGGGILAAGIRSVGTNSFVQKGLAFYTNDISDFATEAPERMRITEAGRVGVGTQSPSAQLHIVKNVSDLTPAVIEGCPEYADNAAATTAGLPIGAIYRTGDILKIVH